MTTVHQYRELYHPGPAELRQCVQGRPHRPAGEQDVVHEDHRAAVDPPVRKVGHFQRTDGVKPKVVTVHGRIERTHTELDAFDRPDSCGESTGQRNAAGGYAEEHDTVSASRLLQDLMGHPGENPADVLAGEHRAGRAAAGCLRVGRGPSRCGRTWGGRGHAHVPPSPPHWTVLKGAVRMTVSGTTHCHCTLHVENPMHTNGPRRKNSLAVTPSAIDGLQKVVQRKCRHDPPGGERQPTKDYYR